MQPVVYLVFPLMRPFYNILVLIVWSCIMVQFRNLVEQTMLMRYYRFYDENFLSLRNEWMIHFEESIQVAYAKIDTYTPRDWGMYNEGKDSGYNYRYTQELLEGHENGGDEAKESYQKIFERELREAKHQWRKEGTNEYSEEIAKEYQEPEVDDELSSY